MDTIRKNNHRIVTPELSIEVREIPLDWSEYQPDEEDLALLDTVLASIITKTVQLKEKKQ